MCLILLHSALSKLRAVIRTWVYGVAVEPDIFKLVIAEDFLHYEVPVMHIVPVELVLVCREVGYAGHPLLFHDPMHFPK